MGAPKIRVLGGSTYLDGARPHGIKMESRNDDGWLRVDITADDGVKGYAITVNGKDVPITQPGPSYSDLAQEGPPL